MRLISFLNEGRGWEKKLTLDELKQGLSQNCSEFLKITNNTFPLYRGDKNHIKFREIETNKNRKPRDSSKEFHDLLNNGFFKIFGKKLRSITVFATSDSHVLPTYGYPYYFVPFNNFTFYWSENIGDISIPNLDSSLIHSVLDKNDFYILIGYILLLWNSIETRIIKDNDIIQIIKKKIDIMQPYFTFDLNTISKLNIENFITESKIYKEIAISNFIKEFYTNKNLIQAIKSGNEIMFDCDKYYLISKSVDINEIIF